LLEPAVVEGLAAAGPTALPLDGDLSPCHRGVMATDAFEPQDAGRSEEARLPLFEAIGWYILEQPLIRSARERPDIAMPWIVLCLAVGVAALIGGMPAVLPVLLVGLPAIFVARLLARRRDRPSESDRPTESVSPFRLVLLIAWLAALLASIAVVLLVDAAAGNVGIFRIIGLAVVFPIAAKALQLIFRV
jgi:hypothetical protein